METKQHKTIRYGSVCSGVEAATLAWHQLGFEPVFFAEVEPFPCAVLQQRFNATKPLHSLDPTEATDEKDRKMRESWLKQINKLPDTGTIPNLGDFTKIRKEDYEGNIDLLVGGTPCQDLSVAGKRAGFEGNRSSLAIDFVRLAYELGCRWFVWENVPGVFSSNDGRDFATLLSLFAGREIRVPEQGFGTSGLVCPDRRDRFGMAWRVLDAQFTRTPGFPFAVPQRRRRVFLVGCLGSWERAAKVLLEPGRVSWNTPTRIKARERLAENSRNRVETASAIRMRAGCDGGGKGALVGNNLSHTLLNGNDQTIVEFAEECAGTLEASYYKGVNNWAERTIVSTPTEEQKVFTMDADRSNSMKSANPNSGFHESDVAKTLDCTVPTPQKAQGGQMIVGSFMVGQGADAGGIGFCEECSPTIKASLSGGNQVPDVVCYENHANDSRVTDTGDVSPSMTSRMGTGGNNVPLVQAVDTYNASVDDVAPTCRTASASDSSHVPCVLSYEHHPQDSRIKETDVGPTCGTFHNSVEGKDCIVQSCYPINSMIIGKDVKLTDRQTTGIGSESDPSPTLQANHHHAVAIAENVIGRKVENGGNGIGAQDELAYTQNAMGVMGVCTKGNGDAFLSDVHTSLSASGGGQAGQGYPACCSTSTVRRLLPMECERLMGFPDGHTQIAWNGKPAEDCPDAPRYKACGNSMCVNVMEWIGRRIQEVEDGE